MKLYYSNGACSLAIRIVLNELKCSFTDESVDLKNKKTKNGDDFTKINAKGYVPALQLDNKEVLTEVQAIMQYLADNTDNQKMLAPVKEMKRYRTLEWLNYISTELHKTIGMFFNPALTDDVKNNLLLPRIYDRFAFINATLESKSFLMGEHFTLPDAYLFVILRWALYFKMPVAKYSALHAYFERLHKYPSVHLSLEQEELA